MRFRELYGSKGWICSRISGSTKLCDRRKEGTKIIEIWGWMLPVLGDS